MARSDCGLFDFPMPGTQTSGHCVTYIMLVWSVKPNAKGGLGMAAIPKKVAERLVAGLKRYQSILSASKARDVGEADAVTIIKDMLADVFE
jgi:hypothetical protein